MNTLGCKWIFQIKRNSAGAIERYKARLVAKEFHQVEGQDYHETFNPVIKPMTIQIILSLAVTYVYVDDIVLTGNRSSFIDSFVQALGRAFSIRDLGPLHYFLGIQVCHNSDGICLSQSQYIQSILTKAGMIHCKLLSSPMATNAKLNKGDIPDFDDPSLYRQAVGALQYLTLTSPDISFMVNKVCQFMHNPSLNQWVAVKRILKYLQHTKSMSFLISKAFNLYLQAFTDSDWANSIDDRSFAILAATKELVNAGS
ncbi:uncharacterized mitochondrial protein AtMg00810-like [Nicotiana tomentosiformis]|uniref:uncharacterized mitochondrial protein AtMg00810-like n=1 Tax=Nicotiana tomentosiformis TaxID=4098 RepID=UPI00388C8D94